jgi:hypothetical protein
METDENIANVSADIENTTNSENESAEIENTINTESNHPTDSINIADEGEV